MMTDTTMDPTIGGCCGTEEDADAVYFQSLLSAKRLGFRPRGTSKQLVSRESPTTSSDEALLQVPEVSSVQAAKQEERDTDAPLEVDPLVLLVSEILPDQNAELAVCQDEIDLRRRPGWDGAIDHALLDGWEPQPSPCCGAASVAGAFNALWSMGRSCERRVSFREVAQLMAEHLDELSGKYQSRIEAD